MDNPLADFLRRLFAVYAIDRVIDVGANHGQYRDLLRFHVGYTGDIFSYEPDPDCVKVLTKRAQGDAKWHIQPIALGSHSGELPFRIMADSTFNSFLPPDHSTVSFKNNRVVAQHIVAVRTLDEESRSRWSSPANTYLKLDTQGYDLEVLRGATEFLAQVRAMQTELSVQHIYTGMPDLGDVLSFVESAGYALSNLFPVNFDNALRAIELDCILINSRFAPPGAEGR